MPSMLGDRADKKAASCHRVRGAYFVTLKYYQWVLFPLYVHKMQAKIIMFSLIT